LKQEEAQCFMKRGCFREIKEGLVTDSRFYPVPKDAVVCVFRSGTKPVTGKS